METSLFYLLNNIRIYVLTVPMRNGNTPFNLFRRYSKQRSYRTYEEWKPTTYAGMYELRICSYRTYEEWKPFSLPAFRKILHGSYRTYEEWKLGNRIIYPYQLVSSYRTYEEWKHRWARGGVCMAEFLPYLWGMETRSGIQYYTSWNTVLTVPMRNGNKSCIFIPYTPWNCSYRTYEEWKHFAAK